MKQIILLILALGSLSVLSLDTIELLVGETTTTINGEKITCKAPNNSLAANAYMQIPYTHQFNMLKFGGIGSCYIKTLQENISFLHTDKFPSGIRISINSGYMINEAIQNGDCAL
jgi:hypothetical protein